MQDLNYKPEVPTTVFSVLRTLYSTIKDYFNEQPTEGLEDNTNGDTGRELDSNS